MNLVSHMQWIECVQLLRPRCGASDVHSRNRPIFKENRRATRNRLMVGHVSDFDPRNVCKSLHFLTCMLASLQGWLLIVQLLEGSDPGYPGFLYSHRAGDLEYLPIAALWR